jgi:hypothetical protein
MVKRFRIPPPIFAPDAARKHVAVSLDDDPEKISNLLDKTGLIPLNLAVSEKFGNYLQKKLKGSGRLDDLSYETVEELERVCSILSFLYVGRRLGTLKLKFSDDASDTNRNDTGVVISACLNFLAKTLGEKQTAQIFRKLETLTNQVLEQQFGRSR